MAGLIPSILLEHLQKLEPHADFHSSLPTIISSEGTRYFGKIGSPGEKEQYVGEAESLKQMEIAAPGLAPRVLAFGVVDSSGNEISMNDSGRPYFLSEYKDLTSLTHQTAGLLGRRLATELHAHKSPNGKFGFGIPTYCGATRLENGWFETWEECYSSMIGDLLNQLSRKARFAELCRKSEEVRRTVIPRLLGSLDVEPVLLHGDLWSGNTGTDRHTGQPVIFDPASYYGHNEADLAIARMFGGIPASFFTTYEACHQTTEPENEKGLRGDLYELFHYLNHTLLFGVRVSSVSKLHTRLKLVPGVVCR